MNPSNAVKSSRKSSSQTVMTGTGAKVVGLGEESSNAARSARSVRGGGVAAQSSSSSSLLSTAGAVRYVQSAGNRGHQVHSSDAPRDLMEAKRQSCELDGRDCQLTEHTSPHPPLTTTMMMMMMMMMTERQLLLPSRSLRSLPH